MHIETQKPLLRRSKNLQNRVTEQSAKPRTESFQEKKQALSLLTPKHWAFLLNAPHGPVGIKYLALSIEVSVSLVSRFIDLGIMGNDKVEKLVEIIDQLPEFQAYNPPQAIQYPDWLSAKYGISY